MPRIRCSIAGLAAFLFPALAGAALPELSSVEPLEYDEDSKRLVARGDARLRLENTLLRADRISYYREFNLADAEGNVTLNRGGRRLLADHLSFDASDKVVSVDNFRTGHWPFYLTGVTAGGQAEEASAEDATLHFGPPGTFTPNVTTDEIVYRADESVAVDGATFRVGRFPLFYVPGYTHSLDRPPFHLEMGGGFRDDLGAFVQTETLFPVTNWLRLGANLDYYTERGPLFGPTAQYQGASGAQAFRGALSTAYIDDQGDTGTDLFGRPIDEQRGFVEWRHKQRIGERFNATAVASWWSDSEVTRDFREDFFENRQNPDTFVEGVYTGNNYLVSGFGRFRPNDFQNIQERVPEARFDLLPTPIFETGAYHRFSASYARLRENPITDSFQPPQALEDSESDRLDAVYRIEKPLRPTDWLTVTPLAGARLTHYANQNIDPALAPGFDGGDATRAVYEAGFDLEARAYATHPTRNALWNIDGLRHRVRPVLRYRYLSDPSNDDPVAPVDEQNFDLSRPILDLADQRNIDGIDKRHLVRLGVENLFETRAEAYGSRTLAAVNFYQDILLERGRRFDGSRQDTLNASWLEMSLTPAPWLKFDLATRFRTESLTLEQSRARIALKSGEIWELGLSNDALNKRIDQYRLDFRYRLSERHTFFMDVRYDSKNDTFNHGSFSLATRLGNVWEVLYSLTFREDARREDDIQFSVRFRLASP